MFKLKISPKKAILILVTLVAIYVAIEIISFELTKTCGIPGHAC